jgi:hypothetical protein
MRRPLHSRVFKRSSLQAFYRWLAALLLVLLLVAGVRPAIAQTKNSPTKNDTPSLISRRFSELELERIRRALVRVRGKVALYPENKRIESIEVVALPVFEPEDPVPQFLNWFHTTTRNYVIEREVLVRIGQPYDQRLSDETERNLRSLFLFSIVVALPLEGSSPDSVRYLIVTKDIWSLRVGWDGRINQGVLDYLSMQPAENNVFGTGRRAYANLSFSRRTYSVGLGFTEPRLAGSRIQIFANANLIMGCKSGEIEGSTASFTYTKPLYSTSARWGYSTSIDWTNSRVPIDIEGNNQSGAICSVGAPESIALELPTGTVALVPNEYLYDFQSFAQTFVRSFGDFFKTNLSFGIEARRSGFGPVALSRISGVNEEGITELTPEERRGSERWYGQRIPRSGQRINPFFQLQSYTTKYHRDFNAETLGLTEDTLLGPVATLRVYPALQAFGSSRDLLGVVTSASYALPVGTGFMKAYGSHTVELSKPEQTDAALSLGFRFTSPRLMLGRFVYDAGFIDRYRNYRNTTYTLGGLTRLRGYEAAATSGIHYLASNLEFRTRPIDVFGALIAGTLFYDVVDTFYSFGDVHLLHGVGGGIRFLLPQLDRDVFRVDVGFPVPFDAPRGEVSVVATFGQAFGVP